MKRFIATVLVVLCLSLPTRAEISWLRAQGTDIINERGEIVQLTGVNLGGWLVEEIWMNPFVAKGPEGEVKDHVSLWGIFEKRLGRDETQRLKNAWRDNWITEDDFRRIRAAGFNHVRLPFIYDLQNEPQGLFFYLDRALEWAKKHQLYVVLDLHGAPGRQSSDHHTGQRDVNRLFFEAAHIEATEKLWTQIAARYKDRPEVAAYDLLNEPMGAPNNATLYLVQDRLYRAIRAVDSRHIIIFEDGYKGFDQMPVPAVAGWKNVAYSVHSYDFNAKTPEDHTRQWGGLIASVGRAQIARDVPVYIGEFNIEPHANSAMLSSFSRGLTRQGWSWALWTYKIAFAGGGRSFWGWFYADKPVEPINPFADSAAEALRKMAAFRTGNMKELADVKSDLTPVPEVRLTQWGWKMAAPGETKPGDGPWQEAKIGADLFGGKAGQAWLRATLPNFPGPRRVLHFAPIDDAATVFLNGQKLTRNEGWNQPFSVALDGAWKEDGPNEIWLLIENTNQAGGLTGPAAISAS
jgi:endoglucanase